MTKNKKIYVVMGPTASGKSGFGLALAKHLGGQIVNADSLQVYADVPLLTARPTAADMAQIPHHLYGYLDAHDHSTLADWLNRATTAVQHMDAPVFVGGTGMYIKALVEGFAPIPDVPADIRADVRSLTVEEAGRQLGNDRLYTDPQRTYRALEVLKATGHPLSYWYHQPKIRPIVGDFETILLAPQREKLYQQCNYRFSQMIAAGALDQVSDLLVKNKQKDGGVFQAIGVKELIEYLDGQTTLDAAISSAQQATRHYAKRQMTWFRHQLTPRVVLSEPLLDAYLSLK